MKKSLIYLILLLSIPYNSSAQKYTETYIKDANKIGLQWWSDVNSREYDKSYTKLSTLLKNRFTLENWTYQMSSLMNEFGSIKNRTITESYFQSELEGFEDGFYVIIEYDVVYSKTRNHTETLLLKQNDKFQWEIFDFTYTFQTLKENDKMLKTNQE